MTLDQLAVDHSIDVNTLTGTARLSVPIRTSPARDSFGPDISLNYMSGQHNSTFGVGWSLSGIPSIGVDTSKGLPTYRAEEDRYVYSGAQELVPYLKKNVDRFLPVIEQRGAFQVQRFRSKFDRSFERFEKWTMSNTGRAHWLAYARNGVVSVFGKASDDSTRIADPSNPDQRTFQWLLEAQYHPKGNAISFQYEPEDDRGVIAALSFETRRVRTGDVGAQRYLKRILYGNSVPLSLAHESDAGNKWRFEVVFDYGEHADPIPAPAAAVAWPVRADPFSSYRAGFEVRTYRLCRRILMFHRFAELGGDCLIGATELAQRQDRAGTVLEAITYRGYRKDPGIGVTNRATPPLKLGYSPNQSATFFEAPEPVENVPYGLDGVRYQWVDLKNEGLAGILCAQDGSWYFKENLGDGRFGPLDGVEEIPAAISAAFHLQDFDGDGNLDLVGFEGREAGAYHYDRERDRWEGFRAFQNLPRVDFANARVQWVDLNGDGYCDLLVDHQDRIVWYPSQGADGFSSAVELSKPDTRAGGVATLTQSRQLQTYFADMTGDGLLDMVHVNDGRVEYFPNLGNGEFSAGVVMEDPPEIEGFGEMDPNRLRLIDLDGNGAADLLYIGNGEVRIWMNQWGNRFGPMRRLSSLPYIDRISSAQIFDFLGDGTRCLVWSTPLPAHEGQALQYLRLTSALPPRLLTSVSNSIGRETRLSYRPGVRDYLRDKRSANPWRTLLPRHSIVVGELEGVDHVGGARMLTRYEYRDGYFDDHERRFVGFGQVDAYDTDVSRISSTAAVEEVTPPSLVRSWYHTGAANGLIKRRVDFYTRDPLAAKLPDPVIEEIAELTTEEQLDACRALAGVLWRQEFYTMRPDGTRAVHPLRTSEVSYRIGCLQPSHGKRDAVFNFVQSELLGYQYEEDPSDPKVTHDLLVESDAYGISAKRVTLAYPRRPIGPEVRAEQQALHAEYSQRLHLNIDLADRFELGIDVEERRYTLTGLAPGANGIFAREDLIAQLVEALGNPLAFHEQASGAAPQARLTQLSRNRFWNDARTRLTPVGEVGSVTLLHHVERAVLPEAAVNELYDGHVTDLMMQADGHYRLADEIWWAEDTMYQYRGAGSFYRLESEINPSGSRTIFTFDAHALLVTSIEDVFGNRIEGTPDYQVLASSRVKDANDNISETLYDPLGVTYVTALRGQQLGSDGNPHPVGAEDLVAYVTPGVMNANAVLADPDGFLQKASRFLFYDLGAFERGEGPPRSILLEREHHEHDGEGTAPSASRIRVTISYIDGFGRSLQTKVRADAGLAIQRNSTGEVMVDGDGRPVLAHSAERWLTGGHLAYNNKGWAIRRYEPFFSTRPDFESDEALRRYGVATVTHYDPVGRIVRQDSPNLTSATSAYSAWETRQSDANDTVIGSGYEAARNALPASDPEKIALTQAQAHARTPTIVELDNLGRPFRLRELGEGGTERITRTLFGATGLPEKIIDPRNLTASTYRYDMLGRPLFEDNIDRGQRWTLFHAQGHVVHQWDGRGIHTERRYDQNGRLIETAVDGALGLNNVIERIVYGDNPVIAQAKLKNARGRAVERYDDAGLQHIERYHMDGQALDVRRSLRVDYKTTVDWSTPAAVVLENVEHRSQNRIDGFGRVVVQTLPDGVEREYDFGALGEVAEIRITTADGQLNRKVIATAVENNARGQRMNLRFGNGVENRFEYDPQTFRLQRLHARSTNGTPRDYLDVHYTYDPVGNITRWIDHVQDPGALTPLIQGLTTSSACEFIYDAFYQLKSASGRVHQALLEHDYRFGLPDADAIKGTRHLSLNNGAAVERYTRTYNYDLAGNIERIRHQGTSQNWTTEIWTSPTANRSLPKHDLNGIAITNPESRFDENGNTIHLSHLRAMEWNHNNRLARAVVIDRSATGDPDDAEYYVYGGDGIRIRRVTERLVAGQVEVSETTYLDGCEIRRISRGANTRLLRQTSHITDGSSRLATLHQWSVDQTGLETDDVAQKKLHYLLSNHLGSVTLELDESGDVISYEEYFPYGGTSFIAGRNQREVKLKEYRYSGKLRDDTTGFYCYEYRYYAPFIGNWLSPDPLGTVDGLNLYRFVHNNPIRFMDSDGLQTKTDEVLFATGPMGMDESQAIRYFNLEWGFANNVRILDLEPEGDNWVLVESRQLTDAERRNFAALQSRFGDRPEMMDFFAALDDALAQHGLQPDTASEDGDGTGTEEGGGKGGTDTEENGDGKTKAHPADGSSGTGGTAKGRTGESGSNGSSATGNGPGAGKAGNGSGGGGTTPNAGKGNQGSGAGTGTGTGTGGTGSGAAPGAKSSGKSGHGGGSVTGKPEGQPGGIPGGTGTGASSVGSSTAPGVEDATELPPIPPGTPISPEGIPYSPGMDLPEVMPEGGTPTTDPSQIRFGAGNGDDRGQPGTDRSSGVRPGGSEGGTPEGTGKGSPGTTPDGSPDGDPTGESGGLRGGSGWLTLPSWLSTPINAALDAMAAVADIVQFSLDVIGLIPGLGEIADGLNGLISLARGDYAGAALSFAAMIPFAGWAAAAGKFGRRSIKAAETVGDVTKAVAKYGDETASVVGAVTKNADEAAQFAAKNADEAGAAAKQADESFEGLIDVDEFSNNSVITDRLSRAREFDIGGYRDLTAKGPFGRVHDGLASDEALQNAFVRDRFGVSRTDAILRDNPATALTDALHNRIQNLRTADMQGKSAVDVLRHHLDEMRPFTPDFVLTMLERESMQYIQRLGL